jgi:hypothetical protein
MKLATIFSSGFFLTSAVFGIAANTDETVSSSSIVHRRRSDDFFSRIKILCECASGGRQRFHSLFSALCLLLLFAASAFLELLRAHHCC